LASLTPKSPLVPTGDKPILGCVVWSHTIFRFFETFCEDASQNKLRMSANFMILGATVQKLWEFEVFRWTLGKAGMCWNQPARVDYLCKNWRAAQKKKKNLKSRPTLSTRRPAAGEPWAHDRGSATSDRRTAATSGQGRVVVGQLDPDC
jgi:hypothetical protein